MKRDFERVTAADGVRDSLFTVMLPEFAVMSVFVNVFESERLKEMSWKVTDVGVSEDGDVTEKIDSSLEILESSFIWEEGRVSSDSIFGPIVSDCVMAVCFVSAACLLSPLLTRIIDVDDDAMCEYPTEIV